MLVLTDKCYELWQKEMPPDEFQVFSCYFMCISADWTKKIRKSITRNKKLTKNNIYMSVKSNTRKMSVKLTHEKVSWSKTSLLEEECVEGHTVLHKYIFQE